ncbi:MAG TPA: hypothetical protein VFH48_02525 [Chloroflexota bacterium]|nr:hypothetical protein [Chloroflexota bacterium]
MRRSPILVDAWRPLPFSLPQIGIGLRRLADTRVQLATGLLAVALFTFIGVVRAPVFVDEADNVLGACLMSRGGLVYRDFFSHHFPAPYYALALLGEGGACSVLAGRVLGVVGLAAASALFALAARNALAPLALIVMGLVAPVYYLQRYLAETFIAIGLVLTLAMLTEAGGRRRGYAAQALRLLGLTILASSSPLGLMMALVLLPLVVLAAGRPYAPTIAACAAAFLAWPAIFAVQGTLPGFVDQAIRFNTQIYSHYLTVELTNPLALLWETLGFVRHRFSFVMDWLIGQETKATAANFAAGFELLLVVLLGALLLGRRDERLFRLGVVLLVPLAVSRDGFHLAPFVALACFGCVQLLPPIPWRNGRLQIVAVMLGLVALRIYFFFLPTHPGEADELAESMRPEIKVQRASAPGEAILYLPIAPQGYLADDRPTGSFYTSFLPWQADIPGAEDRLIADIEQNRVQVIVFDQEALIWDKYRLSEYAPRLYAHILATYRPLEGDRRKARLFVRAAPWT